MDRNRYSGGYLKYYDCLHFYAQDEPEYPVERLMNIVARETPRVIMLRKEIGQKAEAYLKDTYILERNYIIDMDRVGMNNSRNFRSTKVGRKDLSAIADLLLTEEEYSIVYQRETLLKQLLDRFDSGISRFYAAKENGCVIASCSSYGETEDMAIVGGVIVHKNHRNQGLASDCDIHLCKELHQEGKSCISFVSDQNAASLALHEKMGGIIYAVYYKFIRRQ